MFGQNSPKVKIVVVEDDPAQARLLSYVLSNGDFSNVEVKTFIDAQDAAAYISSELVDILITDLDMPVVDGLHLIQLAKQHNTWTQSYMMTGASTSASIIDARDFGATDYLLKPVDHRLLLLLIQHALDRLERWQTAFAGTLQRCRSIR